MAKKKSDKRNDGEVKKLTATVEKLRARVTKAEAAAEKWKAEAKRLEAEASKRAKQVKKLKKESTAAPVPDESWSVLRLRAAASEAGVVGYSRMSKAALLEALR